MGIFDIIGIIIIVIICFFFAPFMTLGVILINADLLGIFGDVLGVIFLILGLAHMINKIFKS